MKEYKLLCASVATMATTELEKAFNLMAQKGYEFINSTSEDFITIFIFVKDVETKRMVEDVSNEADTYHQDAWKALLSSVDETVDIIGEW